MVSDLLGPHIKQEIQTPGRHNKEVHLDAALEMNALGRPLGGAETVGQFVHHVQPTLSHRMRSWESPEREPVAWNKSPSRVRKPPARVLKATRVSKEAVDDLRQTVQTGLDGGDYTMLFLWIRFWSNGGRACIAELHAFSQNLKTLSDIDSIVLGAVVDELHGP